MVSDTLEDLSILIEEKQATIDYGDLPTINANLREIRQLFQNIISNALKFTSDRPPLVKITANKQDHNWQLAVTDNGIGIDPQYSAKIFQMFQRLHHSSEYEGTGIGLAICHKVITSHGGKVWVESQLGEGATFHFILPA
ncbi:MAG: ATP-binding protein [Cyanobacteria bacterium P01_G01_bin.67]